MVKKHTSDVASRESYARFPDDYYSTTSELDVKRPKTNIEEVKHVITALKNKLMERHLMSKKIAELEKILQKINDATNKIIIEMNNRVDDLNRNWQERLQRENLKWKNDMNASHKYPDKRLTETPSLQDVNVNNVMWRTERRLVEVIDRLAPIQKMEQQLEEIIEMLKRSSCYQSTLATPDNLPAQKAQNTLSDSAARPSNFYGVVEITENYSMCLRNLERAIKSLESIKQMSALFGAPVQRISNIQDVNYTASVLKQFVDKLKTSLQKCNFRNSDDVNF